MNRFNVQQMRRLENTGKYRVIITHIRDKDEVDRFIKSVSEIGLIGGSFPERSLNDVNARAISTCTIVRNSDNSVISRGISVCSVKDQFSRDTGSSIAFKRALASLPWDRKDRKKILNVE